MKRVRKVTDKVVEKLYHEYQQADAQHKTEVTGKAVIALTWSAFMRRACREC